VPASRRRSIVAHFLCERRVTREMEALKTGFRLFNTVIVRTFKAEEIDLIVSGERVEDWAL
jgi:hypothetical protein